ncbi:neuropeptide SIFamide [Cotesia typhae]|uniref:neuropeptide SIFamide n=1 Tax=Cotesia typhae TaxID=2053667 RepID=UPI003D687583
MMSLRVIIILAVIALIATVTVEGAYKKPPFNGSIFGKRSNSAADYEALSRTLGTMCEIASETCNAWLMPQDSN